MNQRLSIKIAKVLFSICLTSFAYPLTAQTYNLEFTPLVNAYVGQPVNITVTGTSAVTDLQRLSVNEYGKGNFMFNGLPWKNCDNGTPCNSISATVPYTAMYPKQVKFEAYLYAGSSMALVKDTTITVNFICPDEYCPPNPLVNQFAEWMRAKGYDECIISRYLEKSGDINFGSGMENFLNKHPAPTNQIMNIDFYDIVPTDPQATYLSLGPGEGGNCQYNPNGAWQGWCPSPIPADYLFLEEHFERTFGLDINFIYHRIDTSYASILGTPQLNNGVYKFGSGYQYLQQFATRSIVHWAAQTWNGLEISDMTGASHVAEVSLEPWNMLGAMTYTHEWGHTWGMPHSFVLVDTPAPHFEGFAIDGIMSNTYPIGNSFNIIDPLDPLERFVLEPPGGFLDSATFVQDYVLAMTTMPDGLIDSCGNIDPAILSGTLMGETQNAYSIDVSVTNLGSIFAGYVKLSVKNNNSTIETRIVPSIFPASSVPLTFTIDKSNLVGTEIVFEIDPLNEITDEDENNNLLTFDLACLSSPSNLNVGPVTSTTAMISWADSVNNGNYVVQYTPVGGNPLTETVSGQTSTTLVGLAMSTTYFAKVKRICSPNQFSPWSDSVSFTTLCGPPDSVVVSNVTATTADVTWNDPSGVGTYTVQYTPLGENPVSIQVNNQTNTTLTGLVPGKIYSAKVKRLCLNGESEFSNSVSFVTVCPVPQNLQINNITGAGATFSWDDPVNVGNYTLEWRNSKPWNYLTINGSTSYTSTFMTSGTTYEVSVRRTCPNAVSAFISPTKVFTTDYYCYSKGLNSSTDWIDFIGVETLSNPSGDNGGYYNFGALIPPDLRQTYFYTLYFSAGGSQSMKYWTAWIDFNQDGDLTDSGEEIVFVSSGSTGTLTATFGIPFDAVLGYTRLRVSMNTSGHPKNPCVLYLNGEVEDYTINIADPNGVVVARKKSTQSESDETNSVESEAGFYPNPVSNVLNIYGIDGDKMQIMNGAGAEVYRGEFKETLDVSDWSAGFYILKVFGLNGVTTFKFIKN